MLMLLFNRGCAIIRWSLGRGGRGGESPLSGVVHVRGGGRRMRPLCWGWVCKRLLVLQVEVDIPGQVLGVMGGSR